MLKTTITTLIAVVIVCIEPCLAEDTLINEIRSVASTISESFQATGKKIVAVADFTDLEGNVNTLGRFIAEEISISLSSKQLTVVDRNLLKKMLYEKNISSSGIIDPALAKSIGSVSGAEAIVTGSLQPVSNSIYLSVKLIDVNNARIIGGTSLLLSRNSVLDDLIKMSFKLPEIPQMPAIAEFSPQVKEAADFVFILKDVKMQDNAMVLGLEIKNAHQDSRYLTINYIKAIDDAGNTYFPSSLIVGGIKAYIDQSGKIQSIRNSQIFEHFDFWMKSNQTVKAEIILKNISNKAKTIGFLEMTIAPVTIMDSRGTFMRLEDDPSTIQFTNLPVKRKGNVEQ